MIRLRFEYLRRDDWGQKVKERERKIMYDVKKEIREQLFARQDKEYGAFCAKLVPEVPPEMMIGVRTPVLRKYAKEAAKLPEIQIFLAELPHTYYEENNLHGELLRLLYRDVQTYLEHLEEFLPYVDNWATCDLISPKVFKKNLPLVYGKVREWLKSSHTYTVRFGIVTLLEYFLDEAFEPEMLRLVADVRSEEYYIKMAAAWYFSIALVKQYDTAILYFEEPVLEPWTHNKAIQKAVESRRIDADTKAYLKSLKIKKKRKMGEER